MMVKISSPRAALQFIRKNKKQMFWLWMGYQAVKGSITLTLIWIPLFLLWKQRGGLETFLPDWGLFSLSMIVFIATHIVLLQPFSKRSLTRLLGQTGFFLFQCIVSLLTICLAFAAALQAPRDMVWTDNMLLSGTGGLLVFLGTGLIAFGIHIANPFSVFRKDAEFHPDFIGILAITRHPVLWGIAISALGFLLMNGQVSMIAFYGALSLFSVLVAIGLERRRHTLFDPDQWRAMFINTSFFPNPLNVPKAYSTQDISIREVIIRIATWLLLISGLILLHICVIENAMGTAMGNG